MMKSDSEKVYVKVVQNRFETFLLHAARFHFSRTFFIPDQTVFVKRREWNLLFAEGKY